MSGPTYSLKVRINPESSKAIILEEIGDRSFRQKDIAYTYYLIMLYATDPDAVDWASINQAIIDRWSVSGLKRVKKMAWKNMEAS